MARRLKIHAIESVGVVDEPDNPPARLMFWKRRFTEEPPEDCSEHTPEAGDDLEKGVIMDEGATETQEAAVEPAVEKAEPAVEEPTPEGEDVTKKAEEQIAKAIAERDQALAALAGEVEKRENTEWVEKARPYELLLGDPATMGPVLRKIAQACPDEWATLEPALKAGSNREALAKILGELGTDHADTATPEEKRERYVGEMRKLHPEMTVVQARSQFWQEHPEEVKASRE